MSVWVAAPLANLLLPRSNVYAGARQNGQRILVNIDQLSDVRNLILIRVALPDE